jgi:hypothetical protein
LGKSKCLTRKIAYIVAFSEKLDIFEDETVFRNIHTKYWSSIVPYDEEE